MPAELVISGPSMLSYLVVLSRFSGLLVFLPVPGLRALPEALRPLVALAFAIPFARLAPGVPVGLEGAGAVLLVCLCELFLGLLWGLAVHFLMEAFVLGAQFLALQAGYGYASIVDPSTQADAGLLQIVMQLMASLLFFATGLHRQIIFLMGESLQRIPPGSPALSEISAERLLSLGSTMIEVACRLALPLIALLLLIDLSLALLGRVQSHLQLLSLVFPAKLLVSLFVLGLLASTYTRVYESFGREVVAFLAGIPNPGG